MKIPEWTEEDKILYLKIKDDIKKGFVTFKLLNSYNSTEDKK